MSKDSVSEALELGSRHPAAPLRQHLCHCTKCNESFAMLVQLRALEQAEESVGRRGTGTKHEVAIKRVISY